MDPVVGSVISTADIIGSNNDTACCLINLCSLCNLQFSESPENDTPDSAKVEKILDIFLSDNDEHGQVQLCFNCKLLCTNLICTKQSLIYMIDKITNLLLQNSRFTLINPKYKIIPKLFQFRLGKNSPSPPSSASHQQRTFISPAASSDIHSLSGNGNGALYGLLTQPQPQHHSSQTSQFAAMYMGDDNPNLNTINKQVETEDVLTLRSVDSTMTINTHMPNSYHTDNNNQIRDTNVTGAISNELMGLPVEASLNTPPLPTNYDMTSGIGQKDDDSFLGQLGSFSFPMDGGLDEQINIAMNSDPDSGDQAPKQARTSRTCIEIEKTSPMYICEICGKSYLHKKRLEVHLQLHKETARFQCGVCKKCFTQKCGLQRHLPVHTGELPFQCTQCDKRFRHHSSLNIHKLTHNGKKRFSCHSCDISFFSTSHLRRHQKSHTGFKPFVCKICPRTFSEKYNLESHVRTHTGETAYKCPQCPLGFNRKKKLKHHLSCDHVTTS